MGKLGKGIFVFFTFLSSPAFAGDPQDAGRIFEGRQIKKDALTVSALAGGIGALGSLSAAAQDLTQIRMLHKNMSKIRRDRAYFRRDAKASEQAWKEMKSRNPLRPIVSKHLVFSRGSLIEGKETFKALARQTRSIKEDLAIRIVTHGLKGAALAGIAAATTSLLVRPGGDERARTLQSTSSGVPAAIAANIAWQLAMGKRFSFRSLGMAGIIGLAASTITSALRG